MKIIDKIIKWFDSGESVGEQYNEILKQRDIEINAYNRIKNIINTIEDISIDVKEIKFIKYITSVFGDISKLLYSINTNLGKRFIVITDNKISFYKNEPSFRIDYGTYDESQEIYEDELLYEIIIHNNTKSINIKPRLISNAPMTEEQIYNSIVEIENIFKKYGYLTNSKQHEVNLNKFIERMGK